MTTDLMLLSGEGDGFLGLTSAGCFPVAAATPLPPARPAAVPIVAPFRLRPVHQSLLRRQRLRQAS